MERDQRRLSLESLDGQSYLSLATFRRSGAEVRTPVWFAALDGKLVVFTEGTSGKVKRLRNDSRVRIARCDVRGRIRGDWIDGTGRIASDPGFVARAYQALRQKYGWQMWIADWASWLSGRIEGRAILEIEAKEVSHG
jgi:uncharacterized protein